MPRTPEPTREAGRKGGRSRSPRKLAAAAANEFRAEGLLEGRPKYPAALHADEKLHYIWPKTAGQLASVHKLAVSDGDFLLAYSNAVLKSDTEPATAIATAEWGKRPAFGVVALINDLNGGSDVA